MSGAAGSSQWMYATGYEVDQSLRFKDTAKNGTGSYLQRTPASAGNLKKWTYSCWAKGLPAPNADSHETQILLGVDGNDSNDYYLWLSISNDGTFDFRQTDGGAYDWRKISTALFRDPNAWYHFMVAYDSADGTAEDRIKMYVNGERITSFGTNANPDQNKDAFVNQARIHAIGRFAYNGDLKEDGALNGYLGEVNLIDGLALDASYFGETDATYGHWKPKKYGGAYGTNGFYLPFKQDYTVEGFSAVTYKGTGAVRYVGGTGFQPDLVWIKSRDHTYGHHLTDAVRGAGKDLYTDTTDDDYDNANSLQSFESDGFTLGTDNGPNNSTKQYVAWTWDMGGSNANNTTGSINSVVRANATYGQSIVSYTGTGSTATIGHGLSSAPEWIIIKRRDASTNWPVWHTSISDGTDDFVQLNSNGDKVTNEATFFTSTDPTSSVFSVGSSTQTNANNATHIAYCWHSVTGYSSFGSYTGNGNATGPTITTGFRPAFVMIKVVDRTDGGNGGWFMYDNTRSPNTGDTSAANHVLAANSNAVELVDNSNVALDFLSNGFQLKASYDEVNVNNGAYIYMAFADKREYAYFLDQSGNNNDWQSNNLTESDISVDSPTNNFCTWNPLFRRWNVANTLAEGNTKIGFTSSGTEGTGFGSHGGLKSGKWYWETRINAIGSGTRIGISADVLNSGNSPIDFREYLWNINDGSGSNKSGTFDNTYGADFGTGDIIGVAVDIDNGTMVFYKNNASQGTAFTDVLSGIPDGGWIPMSRGYGTSISTTNWGQDSSFAGTKPAQGNQDSGGIGDFFYTPPSGFLALCTKNLPDVAVTPSEHFNTVLWTGNGSSQSISSLGFQPDFTWIKSRSIADSNHLFDSVRGAGQRLRSDSTAAENYNETAYLTSFDSDGFSLGGDDGVNKNTATYVAWNWKAGTSFSNDASATSVGSIDSAGSVNTAAGFSIIGYTGTGTTGTVAHGLAGVPEMYIVKNRDAADNWATYFEDLGNDKRVALDTTAIVQDTNNWDSTSPSSTVFTVKGGENRVNDSNEKYISYHFRSIDGYSKVGSYKGNDAADGAFVYCGFKPAFVLIKNTNNNGEGFVMFNNKSDPDNVVGTYLTAYGTTAEQGTTSVTHSRSMDLVSNGFKLRGNSTEINDSETIVFYAVAERPFKYSHAG